MDNLVMVIEDVFRIYGKGTVVIGTVTCDKIKIGNKIRIMNADGSVFRETSDNGKPLIVVGIETFNKIHEEASRGQQIGILIRGLPPKHIDEKGWQTGTVLDKGMKVELV